MELRNKPPHWTESLRCWCLASVKNLQLIASSDQTKTIVMQASPDCITLAARGIAR